MQRTVNWYETDLGFISSVSDDQGWCSLRRDDVTIMFMRNEHLGSPHATGTQYIYVDDGIELWSLIKNRCSPEWGPERMPYGMLEFAIKDPNGYLLSFGQRVE